MIFEGCFTAIVTPFTGTGSKTPVDWRGYKRLVEFQNENGIDGIVACGTTGESPTLSHKEHNKVIEVTVENSGCIVIAGTGSNCTWEAMEMTEHAADIGADASLQVAPYYNKPSQEGLFRHFGAIAEASDIPLILYNVPGRTSKEIAPETMARLADEYSNVVGVKEASGKEEVWKGIREVCDSNFQIISGNDGDTFRLMKDYKGCGVISVASNAIPKRMAEFVKLGIGGNFLEMDRENKALNEFFDVLFIDSNPIPVKEALNILGLPGGGYRFPLCETSAENKKSISDVLKSLGASN
ncbi:MAG: 4-hydroxy-tetrahydrodipicolinate synthase [Candidatus Hydrothermarchaeaceae archaeon]